MAETPASVALRRNLAHMNAQMLESARKLKITSEEARDTFCLSFIIDINRKLMLALLDAFDKYDVLRPLTRHPTALLALKTYGFL